MKRIINSRKLERFGKAVGRRHDDGESKQLAARAARLFFP
jgi:hypothetical protein